MFGNLAVIEVRWSGSMLHFQVCFRSKLTTFDFVLKVSVTCLIELTMLQRKSVIDP